jgi:hypothetical protein
MKFNINFKPLWLCWGLLNSGQSHAQNMPVAQAVKALKATELRANKLPTAAVLQHLGVGTPLQLLSAEGGWLLVQTPQSTKADAGPTGWVRASAVDWQAPSPALADKASGRLAAGNTALTLGVRSLPARANRHALIIGISRYADPATPPLPGTRIDKQSATQMAQAMQVPPGNIRYLQDDQATGGNIRQALLDLNDKVQDGDRVFIHFSGHGTRYNDPAAGGCVEALLAYEGGQSSIITNREMASLLKSLTNKTDKLFVMVDACHSGGVVQAASSVRTRGITNGNDDGLLRPKFANITEECARPTNVKTRSLFTEAQDKGALAQDIIHMSASRDNEISFDDEQKGGLATQYVRDCMLRDAKDLDNSGAISMEEVRQCAQIKINQRMANDPNYKPHNLTLNGNAAFVPAWFGQMSPVASALSKPPAAALTPSSPAPVLAVVQPTTVKPVVDAPQATPLTGEQALRQLFDQRDAKRRVQLIAGKDKLQIGQDALDLTLQSDRSGYVYLALAGSDNQSVYMLFPNDLDHDNKIEAGQSLLLPRPNWRVQASGPAGTDHLLVMVTDAPRDLSGLSANKAGPFVTSLNDAQGRTRLGALMTAAATGTSAACTVAGKRRPTAMCSDAYGATMLSLEEYK